MSRQNWHEALGLLLMALVVVGIVLCARTFGSQTVPIDIDPDIRWGNNLATTLRTRCGEAVDREDLLSFKATIEVDLDGTVWLTDLSEFVWKDNSQRPRSRRLLWNDSIMIGAPVERR